ATEALGATWARVGARPASLALATRARAGAPRPRAWLCASPLDRTRGGAPAHGARRRLSGRGPRPADPTAHPLRRRAGVRNAGHGGHAARLRAGLPGSAPAHPPPGAAAAGVVGGGAALWRTHEPDAA